MKINYKKISRIWIYSICSIIVFALLFLIYAEKVTGPEYTPTEQFDEYVHPKQPITTGEDIGSGIAATPTIVEEKPTTAKPVEALPEKIMIDVPFMVQAPDANWDATHEEACEEAALIMLFHFYNKSSISQNKRDDEIHTLINYETSKGYSISITVEELSAIANQYFKMTTGRIKTNPTLLDIKKELASGRPVIIPAAGKLLGNPNFRNGGPVYHMLVIKGYDKDGFITNDPGTRKGQDYRYSFETLFGAIHDWDSTNILNGNKRYLVFD